MKAVSPPPDAQPSARPGIVVVGTGAVGSSLAHAFSNLDYPIRAIVSRHTDRAQHLAQEVGSPFAFSLADQLPTDAKVIFLCVPDDAITPTAQQLAKASNWSGKIVAHTSGAKASTALKPLAQQGAFTMSFHPVQSFPPNVKTSFSDIYIGIEGDEAAVTTGIQLSKHLGAKHIVISAAHKPQYHLAASIASNFMVTLLSSACDILESIDIQRDEAIALLKPLVMQTCTNVTSTLPELALTGPAARGDIQTLDMHLQAIKENHPEKEDFYRALLIATLDVAQKGDRLSADTIQNIKQTL